MRFDINGEADGETDGTETNDSRRRFLAGSAAALGGLALGSAFLPSVVADHGFDDYGDYEGPPSGNATDGEFEDDIAILNYALTLEYLEAEFYVRSFENLSASEIRDSETLEPFGEGITDGVVGELAKVRDHEVAHVEVIYQTIESLGGEPVEKPTFDFGGATEDPDAFLATGMALENTGVSAYAGAAPSIQNGDLVAPALSIHSVEARHASFFNVLNGEIGFPDAFDDPRSKAEVLEIASGFIVDESDDGGDDPDDSGGC